VVTSIEHLRAELHKAVPDLLRPLLAVLEMQDALKGPRQKAVTKDSAGEELIGAPDFLADDAVGFPARPVGPGPRHAPHLLVVPRPPERPASGPLF
jgi:hypothetical protein